MSIKRKIRELFHLLGFEIYRSKNDDAFYYQRRLLKNVEQPIIFDIGAYHGEITLAYKNIFPNSMIYSFEPFPPSYHFLDNNVKLVNGVKTYLTAIGENKSKRKLYIHGETCNSLFQRPKQRSEYFPSNCEGETTIQVSVESVDDLCESENINKINILKIDAEGGELSILKGANKMLRSENIDVVYTEVMFTPHYEGGPLFCDIHNFLFDHAYSLYNFFEIKRASDGQIRWANAIFLSSCARSVFNE